MAVVQFTRLKGVSFVRSTEKSHLIKYEGMGYWIPKSQIRNTIATDTEGVFELEIPEWLKASLNPVVIKTLEQFHNEKDLASNEALKVQYEKDTLKNIKKQMKEILKDRIALLEENKGSWEHLEKIKIAETCMRNLHKRFEKLFPAEGKEEEWPF